MLPWGEEAELGVGSRESEREGRIAKKKKAQTFDVAATNLPCDRRYMGAINELYQPLRMQSDDSGQGVNWILTSRSDTPGPRWWEGKPIQVMNYNSLSCLKHL